MATAPVEVPVREDFRPRRFSPAQSPDVAELTKCSEELSSRQIQLPASMQSEFPANSATGKIRLIELPGKECELSNRRPRNVGSWRYNDAVAGVLRRWVTLTTDWLSNAEHACGHSGARAVDLSWGGADGIGFPCQPNLRRRRPLRRRFTTGMPGMAGEWSISPAG